MDLSLCHKCHLNPSRLSETRSSLCKNCHSKQFSFLAGRFDNLEMPSEMSHLSCSACHGNFYDKEIFDKDLIKDKCVECHDEDILPIFDDWKKQLYELKQKFENNILRLEKELLKLPLVKRKRVENEISNLRIIYSRLITSAPLHNIELMELVFNSLFKKMELIKDKVK